MKTVVIMSHPDYQNSRMNKALFEAAKTINDVTVRHLEAIYGYDTKAFNVKEEQKILESADRIVFQFPMFWLATPAMLKAYIDEIFTYGWAYGSTGNKLAGKELQIVVSLGSAEAAYSKEGSIKHTVSEVLLPLQITADYCGMIFNRIFINGGSFSANDDDIKECVEKYVKLLQNEPIEE
ncbi:MULTISPECIES: NAD(P)H-dependent oxidoreductase [unclassified Campylobacter]|uniref:NAD(P)H-dependent oxidoreductase n=1 Tax=Campylobacter TaxID=194 RepID=UPI0015534B99|nr:MULTISPECIES: NAD(P)H-dependent oxidoreductase [unclassified Campylobacter]QKF91422.1 flavodoxin-like fold domain-containing protein, putative NAD(P)H (quinone) dehydrogenase/reductase [Campylobacter sp. CCUG 57310]